MRRFPRRLRALPTALLALVCLLTRALPASASFLVREEDTFSTLTLTFMGDCILGSEEKSRALPESFDSVIAEKGLDWPFSGVREILTADDLSVINLEGVFQDDRRNRAEGKQHWFRGPTAFAEILPAGSVEVAGLANNHVRDHGQSGHNSTRQALEAHGVSWFGYGDLWTYEKNGFTIGFGGIRETTWRGKRSRPQEEITKLREMGADYIVYTIHAGKEYDPLHNDQQTAMARAIIDAGADLIVGCHTHVPQGVERYNDGLILYSLGNFTFGGNLKLTEFEGLMAQVTLRFDGSTVQETQLQLIPVFTTGTRPDNDFRPIPAEGDDKERILQRVQDDSPELIIRDLMTFFPDLAETAAQ